MNHQYLVNMFNCFKCTLLSAGISVLTLPLTSGEAIGQSIAKSDDQIQEIIVTARKRGESIQTVPGSIQAISGEEIAQRGLTNLEDLASALPGINLSSYQPGNAVISIRGITSTSASPTVGLYLDDVAISARMGQFNGEAEPVMLDVQRVEALKGPQGTLYGASSMGGAIKFVSNQPQKDVLTADVSGGTAATLGGAESYNGEAVANIPLIDNTLAVRVGSSYDYEGGYVNRVPMGNALVAEQVLPSSNASFIPNVNSHETTAARIAIGFWPTDTLSVDLDLRYQDLKSPDLDSFWINLPRYQQSDVLPQPVDDSLATPTLTVVDHVGGWDLTSISAYVVRRRDQTQDYSFWSGYLVPEWSSLQSPTVTLSPVKTLSQELRITTADPSARTQLVAGAYWQREHLDWLQNIYSYGSGVTSPGVPANVTYFGDFDSVTKQTALFADLTYSATDTIDLIAGGREFRIRQYFDQTQNGYFNGGFSTAQSEAGQSGFTPKLGITAKLTHDNLVYALADKGFRVGAVNIPVPTSLCAPDLAALGLTAAPNSYKSDSLWNYEIGTKNTFPDQHLVVNASAFYEDWQNIQQFVTLPTCGFNFIGNVGAAIVKGAEIETRWMPMTGFTLSIAGTYADAYISKSAPGTEAQVGDSVLTSPKWVVNGSMEYSFNIANSWPSFARVDYQWHGSQTQNYIKTITTDADPYTGATYAEPRTVPNPGYLQASYSQLNASAGVKFPQWSARIFIDNVTNQQPLLNVFNFESGGLQTTAFTLRPRTVGVSLSKEFR